MWAIAYFNFANCATNYKRNGQSTKGAAVGRYEILDLLPFLFLFWFRQFAFFGRRTEISLFADKRIFEHFCCWRGLGCCWGWCCCCCWHIAKRIKTEFVVGLQLTVAGSVDAIACIRVFKVSVNGERTSSMLSGRRTCCMLHCWRSNMLQLPALVWPLDPVSFFFFWARWSWLYAAYVPHLTVV